MNTHELKTVPEPFAAVIHGFKTAEFRRDDRGFQVGDTLVLREWNPVTQEYTGVQFTCTITDIRNGPAFGIPVGYAMLSITQDAGVAARLRDEMTH